MAATAHPIYRYSVIPGGAHSQLELLNAIGRDPVVASHYRTIATERVRVETLTEKRRAYVSYRVGDRIYWTKHTVTLPAGEQILTDGVTYIRTRCGNCISDHPQLPTSDQEPDLAEFDALAPAIAAAPSPGAETSSVPTPLVARHEAPSSSQLSPPAIIGTSTVVSAGSTPNGKPVTPADHDVSDAGAGRVAARVPLNGLLVHAVGVSAGGASPDGRGPDRPGALDPSSSNTEDRNVNGLKADGPEPGSPDHDGPDARGYDVGNPTSSVLTLPDGPNVTSGAFGTNGPVQPAPIPEPSTILLVSTGIAGTLWRRVKRRRNR